ncbi:MAG: spermidine/putrescine ABC transporter substrate-binding protein [Candidatus Nanopelagicales bacterium]
MRPTRPVLTRRAMLSGSAGIGAALALSACGAKGTSSGTASASTSGSASPSSAFTGTDVSDTEKKVLWSSWPFYIDIVEKGEKGTTTLEDFTKKTGITVEYSEDINDNEEFWAKKSPILKTGQGIDRDLAILTDVTAARFLRNGYIEKLDKAAMPNSANVIPSLADVAWDPKRQFTMPFLNGLTGIGYNKKLAGRELKSFSELLTDEFKGQVAISSEMEDTMGFFLMAAGKATETFTDADFDQAIADLQKAFDRGQFRRVAGNDYAADLTNGDLVAAIGYSGDVAQINLENPDVFFYMPEEGGGFFSDVFFIPAGATHHKNAEKLIDFYYDPVAAAKLAAYVQYLSPVVGAREAMEKVDPSQVDNTAIFPDEAQLKQAHNWRPLTAQEESRYQGMYQAVVNG